RLARLGMCATRRHLVLSAVLAVGLLSSACASRGRLGKQLDRVLGRGQTGSAFYAARVIDLSSGRELYAVDPDTPVMPASNGKLAVGAAALDFFGSAAVFKTY